MELLNLFIAAFTPVLQVLLVAFLGLFLALERIGVMGKEARNHLNNVEHFVFYPALVASSLAKYMTVNSMRILWFMPLNILLTFIIGSVIGWILLRITKAPRDLWGLVLGCCAAGNLGNMLLIIVPAVCKEKGSPFGDAEVCYNQGVAYSSLSMAFGSVYMWSYVYNIVRIYATKVTKEGDSMATVKATCEISRNLSTRRTTPLVPLNVISTEENPVNQLELEMELECTTYENKPEVTCFQKVKQSSNSFATKMNLKKLFAPSTIGAIVGFIIGITPPFRKVLIGDTAPLHVLQDSASLVGDAAIPIVTLIVGANLLQGLKGSEIGVWLIIGIIVIRYIVLPILGVVIVKAAIRFGMVPSDDPMYQFVLLLQFALPPAMNIGTMTQLYGAGESECSVIMLWTYALAAVSLTLWSTFFMWFVK